MNTVNDLEHAALAHAHAQAAANRRAVLQALKPKGACWYCNAPTDNVRRFCNKACADDYQSEQEIFSDL